MRKKVSVAICTYNGARLVKEQLASFSAQTRLPDELVSVFLTSEVTRVLKQGGRCLITYVTVSGVGGRMG